MAQKVGHMPFGQECGQTSRVQMLALLPLAADTRAGFSAEPTCAVCEKRGARSISGAVVVYTRQGQLALRQTVPWTKKVPKHTW